jgi:hypothetical protein
MDDRWVDSRDRKLFAELLKASRALREQESQETDVPGYEESTSISINSGHKEPDESMNTHKLPYSKLELGIAALVLILFLYIHGRSRRGGKKK